MKHGEIAELRKQLADPRLFDEGVEAARNACVGGASIAAASITAAAWYDNPLTGLPALAECMLRLERLGDAAQDLHRWRRAFRPQTHPETGDPAFCPGFGFVSAAQAQRVFEAGQCVVAAAVSASWTRLRFYLAHRARVEAVAGRLNVVGLSALVFTDQRVSLHEAERSFLVWRTETAIEQAQLARERGLGAFPFFSERYSYEGPIPSVSAVDLQVLKRQVGLD